MWRKRCLVIAPALGFVMASLLLSCGGSSTSTAPVPTSTPVTLVAVRMCTAATAASPVPTNGPCAQPTPLRIDTEKSFNFSAQGQFSSNGVITYGDITAHANWFTSNSLVTSSGSGKFFAGPAPGCSCITAASGSLVSLPERVTIIEPKATPTATPCPPCPGS